MSSKSCWCQAALLKEQLTAAAAAAGPSEPKQALTAEAFKGWSSKIQKQAAKAVELPFSLVRGMLAVVLVQMPSQVVSGR